MPFTDDSDEDETYLASEVAYEKWKYREITRIKRDREALEKHKREQAESQRRRKMTEEERQEEDAKLGSSKDKK